MSLSNREHVCNVYTHAQYIYIYTHYMYATSPFVEGRHAPTRIWHSLLCPLCYRCCKRMLPYRTPSEIVLVTLARRYQDVGRPGDPSWAPDLLPQIPKRTLEVSSQIELAKHDMKHSGPGSPVYPSMETIISSGQT